MDDAANTKDPLTSELDAMRETLNATREELRAAREQLQSVEQNYRALFATHSDAIMLFDLESGLGIEQSPRAGKLFGYTDSEFRKLETRQLAHPSQPAEIAMLAAQITTTGRARRPRMRFQRRDGSSFWGDISVFAFEVDGKRRTLNIIRDVTPTVEDEQRLRHHKELLQTVFDHIPVLVIVFDKDTHVSLINREAEVVLGWPLEDWQAGDVLEACFPIPEERARVMEILARTPSRWIELKTHTRFGRHLNTMWYGVALPSGGTLAIAQNVTEQKAAAEGLKNLEQRLSRKQKLEALGTLAAGVAHEINNPLTWLMGNIEYLQEILTEPGARFDTAMREEVAELAYEMRDGTERIRRIVAGLKPFTRVDNESFGSVDLLRVLDTAVNIAGNELRHRARLVRDFEDIPLVHGNEARLTQVFVNVLMNAAQAIAHGHAGDNQICIETHTWGTDRVCVSVEDTGIGMQPAVRERIFEPFFTTRAPERTGLGLSICHSIIESCGGSIEVSSTPGQGTIFQILLPISNEAVKVRPQPQPAASALDRPARVLVIDDEPNVCQTIRRALREHHVDVASQGSEALTRLASSGYEVILCDIMMPELSGIDIYEHIALHWPRLADQLVFMTGGAFTEEAREFLERVRPLTIQKPPELSELRQLVVQVAQKSRQSPITVPGPGRPRAPTIPASDQAAAPIPMPAHEKTIPIADSASDEWIGEEHTKS